MQALAGLGNPGQEYARTRHNAGAMLLDRLIAVGQILERREKEWVTLDKLKLGPDTLWLLRSKTYMNGSGLGVAQAARSLQIEPVDILVAYDDVDLPLGGLRIRRDGGSGGHRGMESVIAELATNRFPRMRLGVRGEARGRDTADYVLSEFEAEEIGTLDDMLDRALAATRMALCRGLTAAMNHYNRTPDPEPASQAAPTSTAEPDKESRE